MKTSVKVGEVVDGYEYLGGDTSDRSNWREAKSLTGFDKFAGGLQEFAQGLSFGGVDELTAGINSILPGGHSYDEELGYLQADRNRFKQENPKTALALELAGGLTTGIGGGSKIAATKLGQAMSPSAKFLTGAVGTGATYGGLSADPGERLEGSLIGGALGGLGGAAIPIASKIGKGAYNYGVKPAFRAASRQFRSPQTLANQAINKEMLTSGATREAAETMLRKNPDATLAEALDARLLADDVVNDIGKSSNLFNKVLKNRQSGGAAQRRLVTDMKRILGNDAADYMDDYANLVQQRSQTASQNYGPLYDQNIPLTDTLKKILETPAGKSAWKSAKRLSQNDVFEGGKKLPSVWKQADDGTKFIDDEVMPDLRAWDYIKQGLDDVVEKNTSDFGKVSKEGVAALKLKSRLVKELDGITGNQYKNARDVYAGYSSQMNAMKQGNRVLLDDEGAISMAVKEMGKAEKEAYRLGAAKAIRDKILSSSDNSNPARSFMNERTRARLRAVFDNNKQVDAFLESLQREADYKGFQNLLANSSTARREARKQGQEYATSRSDAMMKMAREILDPNYGEQVRDLIGGKLALQGQEAINALPSVRFNPIRPPDYRTLTDRAAMPLGSAFGSLTANPANMLMDNRR